MIWQQKCFTFLCKSKSENLWITNQLYFSFKTSSDWIKSSSTLDQKHRDMVGITNTVDSGQLQHDLHCVLVIITALLPQVCRSLQRQGSNNLWRWFIKLQWAVWKLTTTWSSGDQRFLHSRSFSQHDCIHHATRVSDRVTAFHSVGWSTVLLFHTSLLVKAYMTFFINSLISHSLTAQRRRFLKMKHDAQISDSVSFSWG